mmetsp:Transcript_99334/g.263991  ORF Transcript_99334/g.263991 Transcript_99334/m.263991 type:complete len:252 (+) Transcript_99334:342-1097(+)
MVSSSQRGAVSAMQRPTCSSLFSFAMSFVALPMSSSLPFSCTAAFVRSSSMPMWFGKTFCGPWMARISDASAICFRRSALAQAMRAGSALFLSALSIAAVKASLTLPNSSRLVIVLTSIARPSWISDSSFALACMQWYMALQSTGLPWANSMAAMSSSSWSRCSAWDSLCSASWIMSLTSLHQVTGFRRSVALGDSWTSCWVTTLSLKTSTVQRQRYLSTFEENCLPVTLQEVVLMARCSTVCTSCTVHRL